MSRAKDLTVVLGWGIIVSIDEFLEQFSDAHCGPVQYQIDPSGVELEHNVCVHQFCEGSEHPLFISGPAVRLNGGSSEPVLVDSDIQQGPSESIQRFAQRYFPNKTPRLFMQPTF